MPAVVGLVYIFDPVTSRLVKGERKILAYKVFNNANTARIKRLIIAINYG